MDEKRYRVTLEFSAVDDAQAFGVARDVESQSSFDVTVIEVQSAYTYWTAIKEDNSNTHQIDLEDEREDVG
jgi:hypothetical protein